MPRVKLTHLSLLLLLISVTLIYLLDRHYQNWKDEELHELNKQASKLFEDISSRRKLGRHKVDLHMLPGTEINSPHFKRPEYIGTRGIHSNEYHQLKHNDRLELAKQEPVKRRPTIHVDKQKITSNEEKTNKTKRNFSFTEYIKTEVEEKVKKYLETRSKFAEVLLGKKFNVEAYLSPQRFKGQQSDVMKRFQFNQQASDSTAYNRSLWDIRNPLTKYESPIVDVNQLPHTSVIICFHNEARSALLRTVYSVLSHSPAHLIEEVLLVDDSSDNTQDGEPLTVIPKVNLIRLNKRHGLIRARLVGVRAARGQVLTFLDSHCEVTPGWLEPLLVRIKEDSRHVVSPIIDIIRKDTMKYIQANSNIKGGFGHNLLFKWHNLNVQELQKRSQDGSAPINTPAIAGGLFAIDKTYFENIGSYDDQMDIWGGENVEMSMRVWMCGGTLEIMPCSRVGHIFRSSMPYSFGKGKSYQTTVTKNLRRIAEVWMDDYKHLFYKVNSVAKSIPHGNLSSRLELRKRLECKSFNWYIDNIYPEFIPTLKKDVVKTIGRLKQDSIGCLQTQDSDRGVYRLAMKNCDIENRKNTWSFTSKGHIKHQTLCLTAKIPSQVYLSLCFSSSDHSQLFEWTRTDFILKIKHKASGFCLATQVESDYVVTVLQSCDLNNKSQNWLLIF